MKKNKYFATFISGLHEPISNLLKESIADCNIFLLLDGAVIFETKLNYNQINMHCFNNIFAIIDIQKNNNCAPCLEKYMKKIVSQKSQNYVITNNNNKIKTFRLIASLENQLVSIDKNIKHQLEQYIIQQSQLILNRSESDTEFWILYRNEGYYFFMKRLSKHISYEKILNKGELHPELAYLLNYISDPQKSDICLDPFCGYGSIPVQRLQNFPTQKFYAFDINERILNVARKNLKKYLNSSCIINNTDFNVLEDFIFPKSVDKIITDPPWGIFEDIKDIKDFYKNIIEKCVELIKANGKIVILTAKKEELIVAVNSTSNCTITKIYNILVSGKKAGIFVIEKSILE